MKTEKLLYLHVFGELEGEDLPSFMEIQVKFSIDSHKNAVFFSLNFPTFQTHFQENIHFYPIN